MNPLQKKKMEIRSIIDLLDVVKQFRLFRLRQRPKTKEIKAGATQTETSLLKQYVAGECVDLLDDYDFPARTIIETREKDNSQKFNKKVLFLSCLLSLQNLKLLWNVDKQHSAS